MQRIVIGGGFPESDVGERAILQAAALSELPFTRDVKRWAVLTIGTGPGNASDLHTTPRRPAAE